MVNGSAKCSTDELFLVKKMRNFISIIITFVRINFHSDPEIPHCKDKKRATDSLSLSQQPLYISHRRKGLPFPLSLSLVLLGFLENRTQILLICQNKPVLKNSIFFLTTVCFFVCCLRSIAKSRIDLFLAISGWISTRFVFSNIDLRFLGYMFRFRILWDDI